MAWDKPPPIDLAAVTQQLQEQQRLHQTALARVVKQLACNHHFLTESEQNLGGERSVSVVCARCGFVWY